MHSTIAPETIAAYHAADFRVDAEIPFVMRIGVRCDALAALYAERGSDCCAFITAYNRMGKRADDAANQRWQNTFARALERQGLAYLTGAGCDPQQEWPSEPSCLVLGIGLDAAMAMGLGLQQNAIVWCGEDAVPQLVLLR